MELQLCCRGCAVSLSSASSTVCPEVPWPGTAVALQADCDPSPSTAHVSLLLSVLFYPLFAVSFWFFILSYTILLYYFLGFASSSLPISLIFCLFFVLIPVIPLDHQPGSHLLQCHYFLRQARGVHTKLPICTLPALSSVHGCSGPAEHAPADRNSTDLCPP